MIIKAARLQAWTLAGGGGQGYAVATPPPPQKKRKKFFGYIGGFFATFSSYGGLFATFFSFLGAFLLLFTSWWGTFFGLAPPPPTKISAGAHDCKEGSRACSPEIFLCDLNLVSSGHVLLRFCLKNDKNSDKL